MSKILIITRQKANQRLLADYLGRQHDIIVAPPAKAETKRLLQSETFDLSIVDGPALNQYASALETRKSAEAPLFLPVLLITPRKDVRMVTGHLWRAVDDLIISPIEKVELQARVEILLRARHLSLELEQRNRESLQTSEARYRHIFEGAAVSIWEEDLSRVRESLDKLKAKGVDNIEQYLQNHPDFVRQCAAQIRLLDVNRASLKMFEANSKEDLLISLAKTFSPETLETFTRALTAFARHESRFEAETVFQTLRGRPINVLSSIAFSPPDSPFTETLVSMMDITARKQAEAALRESEAKVRSVIEQATDGISLVNEQGVVIEWNRSMAKLTGLPAEEVVGRYVWDVQAQLDPDRLRQADRVSTLKQSLQNVLKTGHMPWAGKIMEREYDHPDGSRRFIQGSIFPIKTDKGFMLVSFSRDVTARKQAEAALQESERKYRYLIENLNDAVYLLYQGRFEIINAKFQELFGVTTEDVSHPDFDIMSLVAPEDRERIKERQDRINRGEAVESTYEFAALTKTGEPLWIEASVSLINYKDGIATQGILRDITNKRKLEEQLRQAQKMEAVGQLTAGIAHDFNNLLMGIIGPAEMMQLKISPEDPLWAKTETILRSGLQAAKLIRQLLIFSRKQVMEPQIVDLNTVVTNMNRLLKRIIGEHIQVTTKLAFDLWPVKVDPAQIEQVIVNLAINARDAMPDGGKIIIETDNVALDEDYMALHLQVQPGEYVLLTVSDTGIGMSQEVQARIFEPFFTTKELGKGTGLGLATVYGIVKQSGGHIGVYSEAGQGSVFKVYLPRVEAEVAPSTPRPKAGTEMPSGQETILVVEDDAAIRELIHDVLQRQGYTLLVAQNGQEALELSTRHSGPIDLLLTDVIMPGMSGKELAEHLAQRQPQLKVIFISGYTDDAISHHGVLDPGVNFLQKPFSFMNMAHKVRQALDG